MTMAYVRQRITIMSIRKPETVNVNSELQWLARSLGRINLRGKDKRCFRLFIELMESGLVLSERKRYVLRVSTLHSLVDEIERDFKRTCDEIRDAAREVDRKLGLME